MDIREYIVHNFKGASEDELVDSIIASIDSKDEVVLPGLGVLFETLWINSSQDLKQNITNILISALKKA